MPDTFAIAGRRYFVSSVRLAVGCLIGAVALQTAMYLRPAPHGGPFLVEWGRYFWLGLYYELLGVWLLSMPFFILGLAFFRRTLSAKVCRVALALQAGMLTLSLLLGQVDHEVLRFLGVRLNPSFLYVYGGPETLGDPLFFDVLASDRGGPFASLALLLAVPGLYGWWGYRQVAGGTKGNVKTMPGWLAIAVALLPLAAPANGWRQATSQFRLRKVEPVILAFATDIAGGYAEWSRPPDYDALVADYQRGWLARSSDPGWRFPDPARPYLRVPAGTPALPSGKSWNVIYLQLETLRGIDMGALNAGASPSATPFLDRFADAPNAATWIRASSFGMPSINGLFASHCSIAPSSRRYITGYTNAALLCLPEMLRQHGYRAEMFNGGDTDWDNSSPWLRRWYDRHWRFPDAHGRDRGVFRAAAQRLRKLGQGEAPFFVTIVSATNHTPFHNPEPAFDIAGQATLDQRIRNTTHYTDDVIREFVETIGNEPWFKHTLFVIAGDHGFNTGEHGRAAGRQDLYRESVWVPLIMAARHPRLRAGRNDAPASLLDIAPTIADLLGIRVANPWAGHSLLAIRENGDFEFGFAVRDSTLWQSAQWSALRDPSDGAIKLYSTQRDWLQRRDLAHRAPVLAARLIDNAERASRLNDYLLRHDRVWRPLPVKQARR